jgi:hypothetical protein
METGTKTLMLTKTTPSGKTAQVFQVGSRFEVLIDGVGGGVNLEIVNSRSGGVLLKYAKNVAYYLSIDTRNSDLRNAVDEIDRQAGYPANQYDSTPTALDDELREILRNYAANPLPIAPPLVFPAQPSQTAKASRSRGQLWEPCPICASEPVCAGCGYCDNHCRCGGAPDSSVRGEIYGGEN